MGSSIVRGRARLNSMERGTEKVAQRLTGLGGEMQKRRPRVERKQMGRGGATERGTSWGSTRGVWGAC